MSDENQNRTDDTREKEHLAGDPTDSVEQVRRAFRHQGVGTRWNPWFLGIVVTLVVAFGILGILSRQQPAPSPELPGDPRETRQEEPLPDVDTLHAAVEDVENALAAEDWSKAGEAARHLSGVWQRFRPRMQAQGGVAPWQSSDADAFEDGVQRLIHHVDAQELSDARRRVDELFEIIRKYR